LPWYMHAYRPLLSCNNYPIVSVAHATLPTERNSYPLPCNGYFNSVFQTTCDNMYSVNPTNAPIHWLDSDHVICVCCRSMFFPRLYE
jgi:hypothetical protein